METGSVGIENKILCFHPTDPSVKKLITKKGIHSLGFCLVLRIYLGSGHYIPPGQKGGNRDTELRLCRPRLKGVGKGRGGTPDHLGSHPSDKFMEVKF